MKKKRDGLPPWEKFVHVAGRRRVGKPRVLREEDWMIAARFNSAYHNNALPKRFGSITSHAAALDLMEWFDLPETTRSYLASPDFWRRPEVRSVVGRSDVLWSMARCLYAGRSDYLRWIADALDVMKEDATVMLRLTNYGKSTRGTARHKPKEILDLVAPGLKIRGDKWCNKLKALGIPYIRDHGGRPSKKPNPRTR